MDFIINYIFKKYNTIVYMDPGKTFKSYHKLKEHLNLSSRTTTRPWFYGNEITKIYNFPTPSTNKYVISVVSFGGGMYGNISNTGILTNGDVQTYWRSIGMTNLPTVVVKFIGGATNDTSDLNSTIENTIDVECIGFSCPTSNLTIVLYIAPNSFSSFSTILNAILNNTQYKTNAISISWGAPEIYFGNTLLSQINNVLLNAVNNNINITVASGDYGANDGVGGLAFYCDFPSSSPNVIACGGTSLVCPNRVYDSQTVESAWSGSGGAISGFFNKPSYQNNIVASKRSTPDISLIADPSTGVLFYINGTNYIVGGTSISAPIIAGLLGASYTTNFLNPIIYNSAKLSFNDIITGSNGLPAKVGYDNSTGWGSVKGSVLNQIIKYTVSINTTNVTINVRANFTILVTSNYNFNTYLTWTSNNPNIARVSNTGVITGVANGTTTITLNTVNPNVSKVISVTVRNLSGPRLQLITNKYNKY